MATGIYTPVSRFCLALIFVPTILFAQVLTPPYFNLAQGRNITATATCGVGVPGPELYCRLTGTSSSGMGSSSAGGSTEIIQGQLCDYCNPDNPAHDHRPEYATDGTERWWQSPPLSRLGVELNKVNLTISLGQEFHVAYVFIKMANSPRPAVWVLERSLDFGQTWKPWQYFADTPSDCINFFNTSADERLTGDSQVLCTTRFSKVVPLSNGEIVVSLVNGRPNAHNFSYADELQEWTRATDIQLRLLRTKTLLGHLMAIARQDPTVTRRYYYSIKDISIGGRCVCNGHAETCDVRNQDTNRLICNCVHNTCGEKCEYCCPGFVQKKWRRALIDQPFMCEPCECYGHSDECVFDEEVAKNRLSIDIHGKYEGGGVCQNCRDNTMGINCEQCVPTYYRPYDVPRNATDACRPCQCDLTVSTGECEEGNGRCLCRPEYAGINCDRCNFGYYDYPQCIPCECDINGTDGSVCTVGSGVCPCKHNYAGAKCDMCAPGHYDFPTCRFCQCNQVGSPSSVCNVDNGQCHCQGNFGSRDCGECADGYYGFPKCLYCNCDPAGTEKEVCDKKTGVCLCKPNFTTDRCDQCTPGFFSFPLCQECQCASPGSLSTICSENGQCRCKSNFGGLNCDHCAPGYYKYPDCIPCNCDVYGSLGQSCEQVTGQCRCRSNFVGVMCEKCGENFYNYPMCEVCNCNPDGAKQIPGYLLGGCGIVISGLLCECKEKVMGRICDTCKPGYWNLNRNNLEGCEVCQCYKPGTVTDVNRCDMQTGQCQCKPHVTGQNCNRCQDGFYNLQEENLFGCTDCDCDRGGSKGPTCNRTSGQCNCKPRVDGLRCDKPITGHFVPTLHQYKLEIEDGETPEGAKVRYGYDELIFPQFSWRGYAILTKIQPEVLLDVDIGIPSLYQIIYRFVNSQNSPVKGTVTLTPESPIDTTQKGEIIFASSREPKFASLTSDLTFVLNPGKWTVSTNVQGNVFLDYFVLVPQSYYEASQLQERVTEPCHSLGDAGPCVHFWYPDLEGYPRAKGIDGYFVVAGERRNIIPHPDVELTTSLGSEGLAHLNNNQTSFSLDLNVPKPDEYLITLVYHNPQNITQNLLVEVITHTGRNLSKITLASCPYSRSTCRQVLKGPDGLEAMFNITTGYASLYIKNENEDQDVDVAIDYVYGIPRRAWHPDYILPRIICIKINGVCVTSSYGTPVGAIRIDFEQSPNEYLLAKVYPPNILDTSVGLVNLNDTFKTVNQTSCPILDAVKTDQCETELVTQAVPLELYGRVTKPGQYVFLVHYYMPNEGSLNIPLSVFAGGKESTGTFKPGFCPNIVGCRKTIRFDQSEDHTVRLTDINVKAIFNGTKGGQIWLDYLLLVPVEQYNKDYLDLLPIDKSGDFLNMCVDEGFQLKNDSEFCKEGAFTLTTHFNNGPLDCKCDPEGSRSFTCDGFGGQCQCRDNVIGRQCSACRPGFYGFPNCQPCNCPYGLCHEMTGECICPPRVEGERCDKCQPAAYGYDALIGCEWCNCNHNGVIDGNLNCDQITGQCQCKPNIGGRRCDTCLAGYHSFPYCQQCVCEHSGTVKEICNQDTAQCLCKDNVEGIRCDRCIDGTYSLSAGNPKGCIRCFCFGQTTRCDSSFLKWDLVLDMRNWTISNSNKDMVEQSGSTIRVSSADNALDDGIVIYWIAPATYRGKKINSYGGKLKYTVLFTVPRVAVPEGGIQHDILISGNNMTLVYYHDKQPTPSVSFKMEVLLREFNFQHQGTNAPVSKEQFMMVLSNIEALHIRASYYTAVGEMRLSNVSMDLASEEGTGELAESVEMCQCPPSYVGLSCEDCAPSYWRARSTSYLGICVKCSCNDHSNECDVTTGECYNCRDNTTGPHCEYCLTGYYGDPSIEACSICSCPLPISSNNFASTCVVSDVDSSIYCSCLPGYAGAQCEVCDAGYYGNPTEKDNYCQSCSCNNNIDVSNPDSCDRLTGACLLCENDTGGPDCGKCKDWYWGDAIVRKDCQACRCDRCGSSSCDSNIDLCLCKPNVEGINCEKCAANTWGYGYCDGCRDCDCGVGSVSLQCNLYTGACQCQPGVEGVKCDKCQANHWNYGPTGCKMCDCLHDGATGCDPETGYCVCLPGVTGTKCEHCLPRWVLVPNRGCQECDYCVHLLLDDLDVLARNVSVITRQLGEVSVGVGAFNKLTLYNDTIMDLRSQVDTVSTLDTANFASRLVPVKNELPAVEKEARNLQRQSETILFDGQNLPSDVEKLIRDGAEAEQVVAGLTRLGEETLLFVTSVKQQILNTSTLGITDFIRDGEFITKEISARNFSTQNSSVSEESALAQDALKKRKPLKEQDMANLNRTAVQETEVSDTVSRLYDLQNSSRFSVTTADNAMNVIRRLNAVQSQISARNMKIIKMDIKDREDFLTSATELVSEAENLFNASETAVRDLDSEVSRLDSAIPELANKVNVIESKIDSLTDITNMTQMQADNLVNLALELDEMYDSTRSISENAVKAGQAYKNILNGIEEARNSSDQALSDSETANDESFGIENNVSLSLMESRNLLKEAEMLYDQTRKELKFQLLGAETDADKAKNELGKIQLELDDLSMDMNKLSGASTSERSDNIGETTRLAKAVVDSVLGLSNPVLGQMKGNQEKMNYIVVNNPKISEDLRQAQDNLKSADKQKPEIEALLNSLTLNANKLADVGHNLQLSVESLKEKIARARDEANRIKVGLDFLGNTSVILRNPLNLEDVGSYSKVSAFFKSNGSSDGLILYIGNSQNTNSPNESRLKRSAALEEAVHIRLPRQLTEFQSDFLALELRSGRVVFTFNLGSGPARIISSQLVNDGDWHQIIAERTGKSGRLTIKSEGQGDEVVEGTSQGTFVVLELNPITTLILLGRVPDHVRIPRELTTQPFIGSIEDLKFDEESLGVWNFVEGENNHQGTYARNAWQDIFVEEFRFNGMGYAVLSKDTLRLKPDRNKVSLYFKTFAEQGMLFYMGAKDYFTVEISGGRVIFSYDLGGGAAVLTSNNTYNDGEWHKLAIDRDKRQSVLIIDNKAEEKRGVSQGNLSNLETTDEIYIGGVDNVLLLPNMLTSAGFDGCIKDLVVGTIPIDILDNKRGKGLTKRCTSKVVRVVSFPSTQAGYISVERVSIGSIFDVTFNVRTTENNALLLFATDKDQTNTFAVTLTEGRIVVTEELGTRSANLSSRINTYADGRWHYISITKMGQKITMSIDDVLMMETDSGSVDLLIESHIYFGGVPTNITIESEKIGTSNRLIGCLGDITINKRFQNLVSVSKSSSAILAECKIETFEVATHSPFIPSGKCILPSVTSDELQEDAEAVGFMFGSEPASRQEFDKLPTFTRHRLNEIWEVTFKTSTLHGVILYTSDAKHVDFVGLYLMNGQVKFGFNCGSGAAVITSPRTYNDGQWHTVKLTRRAAAGTLEIDGERVGTSNSLGKTRTINTREPHYIGGLPDGVRKNANGNLGGAKGANTGFIGCLRDIKFNNVALGRPDRDPGVKKCFENAETGTYIGSEGGYVHLLDKFRVGKDMDIVLDIRPRSQDGILLGVYGNGSDFLLLQLSRGEVIFTADNGAGPITVHYVPTKQTSLCDGQWHNIKANKSGHILTLTVDGINAVPQMGKADTSSADTNDPLYVGGLADSASKGVVASGNFVGCIRNLYLNTVLHYIATGTPTGDVRQASCPAS